MRLHQTLTRTVQRSLLPASSGKNASELNCILNHLKQMSVPSQTNSECRVNSRLQPNAWLLCTQTVDHRVLSLVKPVTNYSQICSKWSMYLVTAVLMQGMNCLRPLWLVPQGMLWVNIINKHVSSTKAAKKSVLQRSQYFMLSFGFLLCYIKHHCLLTKWIVNIKLFVIFYNLCIVYALLEWICV